MEKILLIYGGRSVEHDISIITALQAYNAIKNDYEILPIYITRTGKPMTADNLDDVNIYADFEALSKNAKQVLFCLGEGKVKIKSKLRSHYFTPTCALVCNHGTDGEDGAMSALLKLCRIPATCPDMASSACCMDKAICKDILKSNNLPVVDFISLSQVQIKEVEKKFNYPIIVKPSRSGSSVGIERCNNQFQLKNAIETAKFFDKKLIFEPFIENGREFNCAVLFKNGKHVASKVCEVKSKGIYSFDKKYLAEKPSSTFKLEKSVIKLVQDLSIKAAQVLECKGVVRVDFLMDESGNLFINEINTIPGSLAFYLFSSMREICVELIEEAKICFKESDLSYNYASDALQVFASSNMNNYAKK